MLRKLTSCQDGAVSANFTLKCVHGWASVCVQPRHRFERFGSAALGGSSTRPRRHLHREVRARRLANPLLCRTHTRSCISPRQPTHALCMSPVSWLAAWSLAEGLATAERYAVAMAVATDMAAARLLPSRRTRAAVAALAAALGEAHCSRREARAAGRRCGAPTRH